jgi:ABC-type branched-subunit amino acid transport system substrate-binding protein
MGLAGCATNLGPEQTTTAALGEAPQAAQKPVRIAMLLPMSGFGPTAAIAKGMKQAGEMALFELDNPNVQLVIKDDKGTAEGAEAAATEALSEGAEIILGPLTAAATRGAAGPARQANVPVISFSNDRQVAGGGVYLMSFLAEQEVVRIVSFAASQGKRRIAALVPADA